MDEMSSAKALITPSHSDEAITPAVYRSDLRA